MTLITAIIILLLVGAGMYLIWSKVPDPWKTVFLVILGVALVVFLLNLMGLLPALNTRI